MENRLLKQITLWIGLSWLIPVYSQAAGLLGYGGIGAGYSVMDNTPPATASASVAGKIYLGMDLFGPFGVEAAVYDLGKYGDGNEKVTATNISLVARLNTNLGSLFAKGGAANWSVKDIQNNTDVSGNDVMYGLGFDVPMAVRTIFRAEWEHFNKVGKDSANTVKGNDVSLLTFSINFIFG